MRFVSHTRNEVLLALGHGNSVWALDTGNTGNDDVLIGTEEQCRQDVMTWHGFKNWPMGWTLSPVTADLVAPKA